MKTTIKVRCGKNAEPQVYALLWGWGGEIKDNRYPQMIEKSLEVSDIDTQMLINRIQAYYRVMEVQTQGLSPLAGFLAQHLEWIWPGRQIPAQQVLCVPYNSTAWHMRDEFERQLLPQHVAMDAEFLEKRIAAYDLDSKHEAMDIIPHCLYWNKGRAEDYLEHLALLIKRQYTGVVRILEEGRVIGTYTFSDQELEENRLLYEEWQAERAGSPLLVKAGVI